MIQKYEKAKVVFTKTLVVTLLIFIDRLRIISEIEILKFIKWQMRRNCVRLHSLLSLYYLHILHFAALNNIPNRRDAEGCKVVCWTWVGLICCLSHNQSICFPLCIKICILEFGEFGSRCRSYWYCKGIKYGNDIPELLNFKIKGPKRLMNWGTSSSGSWICSHIKLGICSRLIARNRE